ncbi:MAG: sensor histidine kinase [Bacteroidetes bacterium]|jgi:signal transduction histidine kinase|nr:sensor histidine kinase [Bacteroidota bacterium]
MQNQTDIGLFIALGSVVMFLLVVVIILFVVVYQRKMLEKESRIKEIEQEKQIQLFKATVEAEEQLKEKIANNLHDSVNPMLSLLKMNLSMHKRNLEKNKFNPDSFKEDAELIDQAVEGIRSSCRELIPSFLIEFGIIKALDDYIRNLNKNEHIEAVFENRQPGNTDVCLSKQDQLSAYRICMEVLNNLFKHAGYTNLHILVENRPEGFRVEFSHNGKGISNEEIDAITDSSKGQGLKSLKVRVLLLNADLNYIKGTGRPGIHFSVPASRSELIN